MPIELNRREFALLLGCGAVGWPLAAGAQQGERVRLVGVLSTQDSAEPGMENFVKVLSGYGWTERQNLKFEFRFAGGDAEVRSRYAAELVALAPDLILVGGSGAASTVLKATSTIPVVFVQVIDPVEAGYVESLARAGGNATGFTSFETSVSAKWLELLKQIAPGVTRVAVVRDPAVTNSIAQLDLLRTVAPSFGVELYPVDVRDATAIERGLDGFVRVANGGVIVTGSALAIVHRARIIGAVARHRLPAIYPDRSYIAAGGMISYAPDRFEQYRRAAAYVDRILRGEKPADLPVQNPIRYETVLNLKTAKALGFEIPPTVLARADEVIE